MKRASTTKHPRDVDPDIAGALAALRRAAKRAHERAFRFGHTIVIYENGEIREIAPQVTSKLKTFVQHAPTKATPSRAHKAIRTKPRRKNKS